MAWVWLNLSIGALFVLAIVGIPFWLVISRPDTGPKAAELAAWRRWWHAAIARELPHHHHHRTGQVPPSPVRAHGGRQYRPATQADR